MGVFALLTVNNKCKCHGSLEINPSKLRCLFTLSHRGSGNSILLIAFCDIYLIFRKFWLLGRLKYIPELTRNVTSSSSKYCTSFGKIYLIVQNDDSICKDKFHTEVHLNTISNGKLSDPLCLSVDRGWSQKQMPSVAACMAS